MKYSDLGLDDVKRSRDKGSVGDSFCCWGDKPDETFGGYGHSVGKGFSMCFQHFVICADCVKKSYLPENAHRWVPDPVQCYKCGKKGLVCYQQYDFEDNGAGLGLCRECMDWANDTLNKNENQNKETTMAKSKARTAASSEFKEGDTVRIVKGKEKGETGVVKEVKPDGYFVVIHPDGGEPANIFYFKDWVGPEDGASDEGSDQHIGEAIKDLLEEKENEGKEKLPVKKTLVDIMDQSDPSKVQLEHLPVLAISEDPNQPRKTFDDAAISELADSIREQGVLQPILVRPDADGYMIVCGERRYRAAVIAGLETIPATIRLLGDKEALEIQITENLQRKDVEPMEEAESFRMMMERMGYSVEDIAARIGKNEKFVNRRLKLTGLLDELKDWLRLGELPIGHAERLAALSPVIQKEWIKSRDYYSPKVPTLPQLVSWISNNVDRKLSQAIFDTEDTTLLRGKPKCSECRFNTAVYSLFGDTGEAICTDRQCYTRKSETAANRNLDKALADPAIVLFNGHWSDSQMVDRLKSDGHHVLSQREVSILRAPEEPTKEAVYKEDYETDEEYQEALNEADVDYTEALDGHRQQLEEYESDVKEAKRGFDVSTGLIVDIVVSGVASTPGQSIKKALESGINDLVYKKSRGRELDKEKVLKAVVEHMAGNVPDGELSGTEMDAIFLEYMQRIGFGQKSEDVYKKFGIDKSYPSSPEVLESILKADPSSLAKAVRISLLSNYANGMPGTLGGTIMSHLASSWCPDVLKTAELEQEEKRIKREAKLDAQIDELKLKIKTKEA